MTLNPQVSDLLTQTVTQAWAGALLHTRPQANMQVQNLGLDSGSACNTVQGHRRQALDYVTEMHINDDQGNSMRKLINSLHYDIITEVKVEENRVITKFSLKQK